MSFAKHAGLVWILLALVSCAVLVVPTKPNLNTPAQFHTAGGGVR